MSERRSTSGAQRRPHGQWARRGVGPGLRRASARLRLELRRRVPRRAGVAPAPVPELAGAPRGGGGRTLAALVAAGILGAAAIALLR
ncbi:MAG: hypothetical protein QM704_16660 [Anaeromyxobacteraceae bacterium]